MKKLTDKILLNNPIVGARVPEKFAREDVKEQHRRREKEKMLKLLRSHVMLCSEREVISALLSTFSSSIKDKFTKGLLQVKQNGTSNNCYR